VLELNRPPVIHTPPRPRTLEKRLRRLGIRVYHFTKCDRSRFFKNRGESDPPVKTLPVEGDARRASAIESGCPVSRRIRPGTASRGYGQAHRARRRWLVPFVASGAVPCARCGELILPGSRGIWAMTISTVRGIRGQSMLGATDRRLRIGWSGR